MESDKDMSINEQCSYKLSNGKMCSRKKWKKYSLFCRQHWLENQPVIYTKGPPLMVSYDGLETYEEVVDGRTWEDINVRRK